MKDIRIVGQILSIILIMWGIVVAHLIFQASGYVLFFGLSVNGPMVFALSLSFLGVGWLLQFLLTITVRRKRRRHRVFLTILHLVSLLLLLLSIAFLHFIFSNNIDDVVFFDTAILFFGISYFTEFYIALRFLF